MLFLDSFSMVLVLSCRLVILKLPCQVRLTLIFVKHTYPTESEYVREKSDNRFQLLGQLLNSA